MDALKALITADEDALSLKFKMLLVCTQSKQDMRKVSLQPCSRSIIQAMTRPGSFYVGAIWRIFLGSVEAALWL